jgi:hypothetical protein
MILIFKDLATYNRLRDDIVCTPLVENEAPILLQEEPAISPDGRCLIEYQFSRVILDWLEAYTNDENPSVIFVDKLPEDWYGTESPL